MKDNELNNIDKIAGLPAADGCISDTVSGKISRRPAYDRAEKEFAHHAAQTSFSFDRDQEDFQDD